MSVLGLLVSFTVQGADLPNRPPAPDEVVVTGRADALERFVEGLAVAPNRDQVARWDEGICPKAVGLSASQAAYLSNRMRTIAREHGVPVAPAGCGENIFIVVTAHADAVAALLAKRHPHLLQPFDHGRATRAQIAEWLRPRPVRQLYASRQIQIRSSATFVREYTERHMAVAILLVDETRLGQATWGQLTAYLSMLALTRAENGFDAPSADASVLGLFREAGGEAHTARSLTRWDKAFLRALYSGSADLRAGRHRAKMRSNIARALASGEAERSASPAPDQRE